MKQYLTIAVILLCCAPSFAAPLSLEECIDRGLSENPEIKAYQLAVEEAGEGIKEAWGAFFPTLSLNYGYNQLSNDSSGERDTDYLDQDSDSFSCRLSQPVFAGFSGVAGLKRARRSKQYRHYELKSMQQQLVREIRTSFYDILRATALAEKWAGSIRRLEKQRRIAEAWCRQELAPRLRLLEVEVELSNARQQLISAESSLAIARARLKEWLALDGDEPLDIAGSLEQEAADPCTPLDACLQFALDQRPELHMMRLNIEIARQDARVIAARNLPQVSIDAGWTDYQRDYDDTRHPDDERDYYSVSINLSMKPFQGGRNLFAWRRQRLAVQRLQHRQVKQRHAVTTEVKTRYQQLQEAHARLTTAGDSILEAREAYRLAGRSADLGMISLNDLLDAELRLARVEINMIDTRHALQIARIQLEYSVGN
ncbi:MAG: TolC family protein [Deltaproteobacteria bacterium]|nr:TolC family protein [Deltaproteobacteria bacterium]